MHFGDPSFGRYPPLYFQPHWQRQPQTIPSTQDGLLRTARIFIPQCPTKSREVPSEETHVTVQLTECLSFLSKTISLSFG